VSTAVLFKFAYLIRHDGNTKEKKKTVSSEAKLDILHGN
jgi:hypothetical protein